MSVWKEYKRSDIGEITLVVNERTDFRNHHGALEYLVEAFIDGKSVLKERVSQSKWLGHCYGQLLLPEIAKRAASMPRSPI